MGKRDKTFENEWIWVKNQSLATAAREAGFDLAMFDEYSEDTQKELRKKSVKYVLRNISDAFEEEAEYELSDVSYGVYVIRLSAPFSVQYRNSECENGGETTSQVIYIGRGDVLGRLKGHFERKLFDFMQSLSGAEFDIQILDPNSDHYSKNNLHKQIEHDLLEAFAERITCKNKGYPLLNKNSGDTAGLDYCGEKWDAPLRKRDKRMIEWMITPTDSWRSLNLDR